VDSFTAFGLNKKHGDAVEIEGRRSGTGRKLWK
jgi:hypothetical protein